MGCGDQVLAFLADARLPSVQFCDTLRSRIPTRGEGDGTVEAVKIWRAVEVLDG